MDTTIAIKPENLYVTGYVIEFPQDGEAVLLRDKLVIVADDKDQYHPYRKGEKLRLIAYKYYKDYNSRAANLWWVIADTNNIFNPRDLAEFEGKNLLIPDYEKVRLLIPSTV